MKKKLSLLIVLFLLSFSIKAVAQTVSSEWTKHQIKKWYKKKEWLGGLQIQPHKTVNKREFARQYQTNRVYWDKAFTFLKENDLQTLTIGKHTIDSNNVYALVTQNPTKLYDSTQWESHRGYVDLQHVISGEEKMGVTGLSKLIVTKPYDASKDLINYSGDGKIYMATPKTFFLFFPSDAHRPNLTTGDNKADKKVVIKIRYAD